MQFNDDENEPLNNRGFGKKIGNVNETGDQSTVMNDQDNNGSSGWDDEKKKKYIKWGIIGGLIFIAVVLAIVLPITLGGGRGPEPPPTPPPPEPPFDRGINFYRVGDVQSNKYQMQGVITFDETQQSAS